MNEEDSEEELSDEGTLPVGGPSIITFQDPSKKPEASASDKALGRTFMVRDSYGICDYSTQYPPLQVVESFQTTAGKHKSNK